MDIFSSKLIVGCYIGLALAVCLITALATRHALQDDARLDMRGLEPAIASPRDLPGRTLSRRPRNLSVSEQSRTIEELRQRLTQRTALLQQQAARLDQKTEEHQRLRAELDDYIWLVELLSEDLGGGNMPAASTTDNGGISQEVRSDLLLGAEALQIEVAALQAELDQSRAWIIELETSAMGATEMSSEATKALISTGAAAVPALINVLSHENSDLRRWAATVLGQIGTDALDAVDRLLVTLEDRDVNVRAAARSALNRIEEGL